MIDTAYDRSLELPCYWASPTRAVSRFFRKYATFSGRAGRAEYWWWTLVATLVPVLIQVVTGLTTGTWRLPLPLLPATVAQLFALAVVVPTLALTWRRLHDTDRTGLWALVGLVPLVGWIVLLVFTLQPANPVGTRFDRVPTTVSAAG